MFVEIILWLLIGVFTFGACIFITIGIKDKEIEVIGPMFACIVAAFILYLVTIFNYIDGEKRTYCLEYKTDPLEDVIKTAPDGTFQPSLPKFRQGENPPLSGPSVRQSTGFESPFREPIELHRVRLGVVLK